MKKRMTFGIALLFSLLAFFACKSPTNGNDSLSPADNTTIPSGTWVASSSSSVSTVVLDADGNWIMVSSGGKTVQAKGTSTWKNGTGTVSQKYYRASPSDSWSPYSNTITVTKNENTVYMGNVTYNKKSDWNTLELPSNLKVTVTGSTSLKFSWDGVEYASKYRIYHSKYQSIGSQSQDVVVGTSFSQSGLTTGQRYFFRVQALIDDKWGSEASDNVCGTPQ